MEDLDYQSIFEEEWEALEKLEWDAFVAEVCPEPEH